MGTNPYINNWSFKGTQDLIEDLLAESIAFAGINTMYIPRTVSNIDKVFGEPEHSAFNSTYVDIEMYLNEPTHYGGEGELLSKFGVEIRDNMTFWVSAKRFAEETNYKNMANAEVMFSNEPREGDLIYIDIMQRSYFQIMFVELRSVFFAQGTLPVYELSCEKFEYSGETFATGNTIIDSISTHYPVSNVETTQPDDTESFDDMSTDIIDFSEDNPFSEKW